MGTAQLAQRHQVRDDDASRDAAPVRVLIADDHPLILIGLRRMFEREEDLEVVGEAATSPELIDLIERRSPDVVLLDLSLPGVGGAGCVELIAERWPQLKTVVLSARDDRASIEAVLAAGACAYIVKSVAAVDVAGVVRQAHRGAVHYAPPAAPARPGPAQRAEQLLTERENAILTAIADGMTTRAISSELWVSEHTIKFHLTNIYRKLGVANRSGAVRVAVERELAGVAAPR
jgi:DNA-binding NarL/FixJ family response regulator